MIVKITSCVRTHFDIVVACGKHFKAKRVAQNMLKFSVAYILGIVCMPCLPWKKEEFTAPLSLSQLINIGV